MLLQVEMEMKRPTGRGRRSGVREEVVRLLLIHLLSSVETLWREQPELWTHAAQWIL